MQKFANVFDYSELKGYSLYKAANRRGMFYIFAGELNPGLAVTCNQ